MRLSIAEDFGRQYVAVLKTKTSDFLKVTC